MQDGWRFTATEVEGRRIRRVEVTLVTEADISSSDVDTR
jgi:CBS domain containing-hemolysin-like protein